LTSTLHALDHASRFAEVAAETGDLWSVPSGSADVRARELCAEAMRHAALIAGEVGGLADASDGAAPLAAVDGNKEVAAHGEPTGQALIQLEQCASTLRELQGAHRKQTLGSVAAGVLSADEAMARVDMVRRLD